MHSFFLERPHRINGSGFTHTLHVCGKHLHTKVPLILGSCNSLQCLETKLRKLLVQFQQYPDTNRIQWGDINHIRVSYQIRDRVQCPVEVAGMFVLQLGGYSRGDTKLGVCAVSTFKVSKHVSQI